MANDIQRKLDQLRTQVAASKQAEQQRTNAGIQNPNDTVDTPGEVKAIYNNDGPATTDFKSRARLKAHVGPVDTESEKIEQQNLKPR